MIRLVLVIALLTSIGMLPSANAESPTPSSVAEIQTKHDRALVKDLVAYLAKTPKPDDLDQAYLTFFNKVIEHDWFLEHEAIAKAYLKDNPEGPVRPLAQIVATMARAQAGGYPEALANFKLLMDALNSVDQLDFAANFADNLAGSAASAGEIEIARDVYATLLKKFGADNPPLRQKVGDDLARLDRVGKPAPPAEVKDVDGKAFRFETLKGKYVLVDFWATWCAPCLAELPRIQAARAKYHARGFEVVSISLDETKGPVVDFVKVRKLPWVQIHNATCVGDLVQAFGVSTIPATFLIDPKGTIVRLDLRGPALDKALESLIK
jgi:thiol-disulfide isomerase/thioredoxin